MLDELTRRLGKPIAILSVRVPPEIYKILERKAIERGMRLSQLVRMILTSVALGLEGINVSNINQLIVVNVNLNVNNNEVKPSITNTVTTDSDITKEYVKTLEEDLRRAKEVIRRKNEEVKQLRRLLDKVRSLARAGDVRNIRRVLGV